MDEATASIDMATVCEASRDEDTAHKLCFPVSRSNQQSVPAGEHLAKSGHDCVCGQNRRHNCSESSGRFS